MWWRCLGFTAPEVFVSHRGARLAVFDRQLLADRVCLGRPVAHMAGEMGVSRRTGHKWMCRWRAEGDAGLYDRPSQSHTTPHRTSPGLKRRCAGCGASGVWTGRWSRVRRASAIGALSEELLWTGPTYRQGRHRHPRRVRHRRR